MEAIEIKLEFAAIFPFAMFKPFTTPDDARLPKLLAKPFGPFSESDILDKKCTTTRRESAALTSLMLECGGKAIG
jgi:hypothetical protein